MKVLLGRIMKWLADLGSAASKTAEILNPQVLVPQRFPRTTPLCRPTLTCLQKSRQGHRVHAHTFCRRMVEPCTDAGRCALPRRRVCLYRDADGRQPHGVGRRRNPRRDITENGKMPFTCTDTPASAITVIFTERRSHNEQSISDARRKRRQYQARVH